MMCLFQKKARHLGAQGLNPNPTDAQTSCPCTTRTKVLILSHLWKRGREKGPRSDPQPVSSQSQEHNSRGSEDKTVFSQRETRVVSFTDWTSNLSGNCQSPAVKRCKVCMRCFSANLRFSHVSSERKNLVIGTYKNKNLTLGNAAKDCARGSAHETDCSQNLSPRFHAAHL